MIDHYSIKPGTIEAAAKNYADKIREIEERAMEAVVEALKDSNDNQ